MVAGIAIDPFLARSMQQFLGLTEGRVTTSIRVVLDEEHAALLVNVLSTAERLKLEVRD